MDSANPVHISKIKATVIFAKFFGYACPVTGEIGAPGSLVAREKETGSAYSAERGSWSRHLNWPEIYETPRRLEAIGLPRHACFHYDFHSKINSIADMTKVP
jgi:hypothetical protein